MNCEEALLVVDKAIFAKADRHLNDAEVTIFRGSWEGQTYDEMAEKSGYQANYLKGDAGHKFWKLLSEVLEEPVGKRNFRAAVERARSRFPLETGSGGRSPFGAVIESQEAKQSSSESGDAGEESQSQTLPSSRSEKPKMLWQIVLETEEISNLDALIEQLEKLGEGSIMIKRIEKGSVVLIVESSPEVFERIEYLFTSGQLTEVLEIPVKDVHGGETSAVVNLGKWFDHIVEAGWQTIEEMREALRTQELNLTYGGSDRFRDVADAAIKGNTSQEAVPTLIKLLESSQDKFTRLQTIDLLGSIAQGSQEAIAALTNLVNTDRDSDIRRQAAVTLKKIDPKNASAGVRRGKIIDLGMQLGEIQVALAITLMPELDRKTNVHLRVYPLKGEKTLPPNLQLIVLNDKSETLLSTESGNADNAVQLELRGDRGDYFTVKVALGNASIMEKFVL